MTNIFEENLTYLNHWMNINPKLKENLTIEGSLLSFQKDNQKESVSLTEFYLPEMLYNERFREDITSELTSYDLVQIIKMYIKTFEIRNKKQKELQMYPKIKDLKILKDKNGISFIAITDEHDKKYRYDTEHKEQILNLYNQLKMKNGYVTLKDLGGIK